MANKTKKRAYADKIGKKLFALHQSQLTLAMAIDALIETVGRENFQSSYMRVMEEHNGSNGAAKGGEETTESDSGTPGEPVT